MTDYLYKARNSDGDLIEKVVKANSKMEVIEHVNKKGLITVSIEKHKKKLFSFKSSGSGGLFSFGMRISKDDLAVFCRQLATMINAGVVIMVAISSVKSMTRNPKLKKILSDVARSLSDGKSLSDSFVKYSKTFGSLFIPMIRVGEKSGDMDVIFNDIADYNEKVADLQRKVQSAAMYPLVIICFMSVVFIGVFFFLVPQFEELFTSLGAELPLATKIVIGISNIMVDNALYFIIFLFLAIVAFKAALNRKRFRFFMENMILNIPYIGDFLEKIYLARFFHALGALLKSGVGILESLEISKNVINSLPFKKTIHDLKVKMSQGSNMSEEMAKSSLFTSMAAEMVSVGEKSGSMPEMLEKVNDYYTKYITSTVDKFGSIVEPFLTIFLGVFVGLFVIIMYLPIFRLAAAVMGGA
ncbi:MAG: type II secretion system F family protein [Elusimicrobiota bacterium]